MILGGGKIVIIKPAENLVFSAFNNKEQIYVELD